MHQRPDNITDAQRAVFDARRDESHEGLINNILLAVDPEFYFGSQVMDVIVIEAKKAD